MSVLNPMKPGGIYQSSEPTMGRSGTKITLEYDVDHASE
jgi:hypothetical protein